MKLEQTRCDEFDLPLERQTKVGISCGSVFISQNDPNPPLGEDARPECVFFSPARARIVAKALIELADQIEKV